MKNLTVKKAKKSIKKQWILEVQKDPKTDDYFLEFPTDLLETTGWKSGDTLEWKEIEKDISYSLKKVE